MQKFTDHWDSACLLLVASWWREQPAASSPPFLYTLVPALLPLPRPTGVESAHNTSPVFRGSSKACWHKVPFKAYPGILSGMRVLKPSPFQGRAKCAPPCFCSRFLRAHDIMVRRLSRSSPAQTALQTAGEAAHTSGQRFPNRTHWDLVIRSWVSLELGYRGKTHCGTNCGKEEGIVPSLCFPPALPVGIGPILKLYNREAESWAWRIWNTLVADEAHPIVCYTLV